MIILASGEPPFGQRWPNKKYFMLKQCLGTIDVLLERARDYGMQVFLVKRNTFLSKGGLKSGYKARICISSLKRKNS